MATPEDNVDKGLFEQDPHVDQLRPEPSAPPSDVVILEGLAGKSDREGWARLYFNRTLTYYAEFRREDIVFTEAIPPEQAPMIGLKATRVGIKKDAVIEYTRTTRAREANPFDLDVRLASGPQGAGQPGVPLSNLNFVCNDTIGRRGTCNTCRTDCDQATCETCQTQCGQPTCPQTQCATCETCETRCGQPTCTCRTQCDQQTCQATCDTCNTQCNTACNTRCLTCRTFDLACCPH